MSTIEKPEERDSLRGTRASRTEEVYSGGPGRSTARGKRTARRSKKLSDKTEERMSKAWNVEGKTNSEKIRNNPRRRGVEGRKRASRRKGKKR